MLRSSWSEAARPWEGPTSFSNRYARTSSTIFVPLRPLRAPRGDKAPLPVVLLRKGPGGPQRDLLSASTAPKREKKPYTLLSFSEKRSPTGEHLDIDEKRKASPPPGPFASLREMRGIRSRCMASDSRAQEVMNGKRIETQRAEEEQKSSGERTCLG